MNALNQLKKGALSLKTYASFSFIIFLLPFLQTCSDKQLKENLKNNFSEEKLLELKKEKTFNAYYISYNILSDFKSKDLTSSIFYAYLIYPIIIVMSIIIFVQSFRKRFKSIFYLTSSSSIFFILSVLLQVYVGIVKDLNQLKIGWYLFLLNSLFMLYFSYKKGFKQKLG